MAAAAVRGLIFVAGGLTGAQSPPIATRAVEAYDPAINSWTRATPLPLALHHPMAVAYRNELVVIGGFVPQGANLTARVSDGVYALLRR